MKNIKVKFGSAALLFNILFISCTTTDQWMEQLVEVYGTENHGWRPGSGRAVINPQVPNQESLGNGHRLYKANCQPCHGEKGRGDGVLASRLSTMPGNFTQMKGSPTDYHIYIQTTVGGGSMAAIKSLKENERWDIVNYIQHFLVKLSDKNEI